MKINGKLKHITFISISILILIVAFIGIKVNAQSNDLTKHINGNGIELTEKEYQFVNEFYGSDFFDTMSEEDYEWISTLDINHNDVEITTTYNNKTNKSGLKRIPSYSTNSKRLSIAKSCGNSSCQIITNLTWLVNPTIRSYDVIGARFSDTSYISNSLTTKVSSSNGTEYFSSNLIFGNGLGASVKLPTGATNISVQQKFNTTKGGKIYCSYQHAKSNISLATSFQYVISSNGLGRVFSFYGNASGKFDGMNGVEISL